MNETATPARPAATREPLSAVSALMNAVRLAFLAGILLSVWVLLYRGGWHYYTTPLSVRGYDPAHRFLRPSGRDGHLFGIAGTLLLFSTLPYLARKRLKILRGVGTVRGWLEFHIFCGIFGPILITYHTAFKFNGVISVAYWSMALVMLSGFVGRYLYVRIPTTIRGEEVSRAELEERARELKARIAGAPLSPSLLARIEELEEATPPSARHASVGTLIRHAWQTRRIIAGLRRDVRRSGADRHLLSEVLDVVHERTVILRRLGRLEKTRQLFQWWHVFHRPLVWVMFLIFFVHVSVAIYFGYAFF